jgi:hypothetical protein
MKLFACLVAGAMAVIEAPRVGEPLFEPQQSLACHSRGNYLLCHDSSPVTTTSLYIFETRIFCGCESCIHSQGSSIHGLVYHIRQL